MIETTGIVSRHPFLGKVWRMAKVALPMIGVGAVGAALYRYSPDCRDAIDWVRAKASEQPRACEMGVSSLTLGFVPDLLAQRCEGGRFNWRRSVGMSLLGSLVGGVGARALYNFLETHYPGQEGYAKWLKIGIDQGIWTPFIYLPPYLSAVNFIKGERPVYKGVITEIRKILPWSWIFWGGLVLPRLYETPQDLKVYLLQPCAMLWYFFQTTFLFKPKTEPTDKPR